MSPVCLGSSECAAAGEQRFLDGAATPVRLGTDQDSPCVKFDINEVHGQEKGYRVLEMKLCACDPM